MSGHEASQALKELKAEARKHTEGGRRLKTKVEPSKKQYKRKAKHVNRDA